MPYVDGFIVPVPKKNLAAYRAMARKAGKVWREHGALEFRECVADDLAWGIATSFPRSVRLEEGEVVVLSWATYRSREHRDEVIEAARDDPWHALLDHGDMPFDLRRVYFGGFEELLALSAAKANGRAN